MAQLNGSVCNFVSSGGVGLAATRHAGRRGSVSQARVASTGPAPARPAPPVRRSRPAYRLSAVLVDKTSKRPLSNVRVEAWDAAGHCTDLLAIAKSNESGSFTMELSRAAVAGLLVERRPVVELRLFTNAGSPLPDPAWRWVLGPTSVRARIEVRSDRTGSSGAPTASVVRGRVRTYRGLAMAAVEIRVLSIVPGAAPVQLGSVASQADGSFEIPYSGDVAPDLVVRAVAQERGADRTLAESPRICRAGPTTTVDLTVGGRFRGPSEHERITARIAGYQGDLATAGDDEIDQLACRSGVVREQIATLAAAKRIARDTSLDEAAAYGLLRSELPEDRATLLRTRPTEVRARLRAAIARNHVPTSIGIESTLRAFRSAARDFVFEAPQAGEPNTFGQVVQSALPASSAMQQAFVDHYLLEEGTHHDFWATLPSKPGFATGRAAQTLRFALQAAALSSAPPAEDVEDPPAEPLMAKAGPPIDLAGAFHLALVDKLLVDRSQGTVGSLRDLARYTDAQFDALVDQVGVPPGTPGLSDAARKASYSRHLRRTVRAAFPTTAVAAGVQAQQPSGYAALTTFFGDRANDGFELGKTRVARHVASATGALSRIPVADRAAAVENLKSLERLFKLTADYQHIHALYQNGIRSAAHAHSMGVESLVAATGMEKAAAKTIYDKSCAVAGNALALQSVYGSAFNKLQNVSKVGFKPTLYILPDNATLQPNLGPPLADWEELFGSEGACSCEHCHSVLSPAAYLVDLLSFLDGIQVGGSTARALLLSDGTGAFSPRRPDIAKIDLSCPNTDTPLPYVDLVNEILEHVVAALMAQQTQLTYPDHLATNGHPRDLLATPEILDPPPRLAAYTNLRSSPYPWSLPFHFWLAEARAFAPQLGVPLHALMHALQPGTPPLSHLPAPYAYDTQRAWERLGLWEQARDILLGQAGVSDQANWGFAASDNAWATKLVNAQTFLEKSALTYDQLGDLLDTQFIRAFVPSAQDPNPYLVESGSVVTCDLSKMTIKGLASPVATAWGTLHRFLRLQRRLGWTIDEIDYATSTFASLVDSDTLLRRLAIVEHFHRDRKTEIPVVLSWFGAVDTRRRGRGKKSSFYERLFQNPALRIPVEAAFDLLNPDGPATPTELASTSSTLADHALGIRAALRLSARDFDLITDSATANAVIGEGPVLPASSNMTLANLSTLHRIATWARALRLSVQELLSLKRLWGLSGFGSLDPETVYLVSQAADRLRGGGLKPSDLLFVLFGLETSGSTLVPGADADATLRAKLGAALVKVRAAIPGASDPAGEQLLAVLETLFTDPNDVTEAMNILGREDPPSNEETFFDTELAKYFAHTDAKARFFGTSQLPELQRRAYAYGHLRAFVEGEKAIAQTIGADRKLSPAVAHLLLTIVEHAQNVPLLEQCRLARYASEDAAVPEPPPTEPPLDAADVSRICRAAAPLAALKVTPDELVKLFFISEATAWNDRLIDLNKLVTTATDRDMWFRRWLLAVALWKLRAALPGGRDDLVKIFPDEPGTEQASAILARAATLAEWPAADVVKLGQHFAVSSGAPQAPDVALALTRLHLAFTALRPFRTDATTAIDNWLPLGTAAMSVSAAEEASGRIVRAVKARYSEEEWPDVARPLRDQVREEQRDALVQYLLASGYAKNADELYAWLLVDTEMSPCMMTSRIKQALGSVQTFVQRAQLGLEPDVTLNADKSEQWKWMKYYRVWEANRKVFLFPENWLEPALRDDKTQFFKDFESQIRRQEITDETAEEAFIHYLERVADIADLEVVALHAERTSPGAAVAGTVHLVGRTRSVPRQYYYRTAARLTEGTGPRVWTPWERIELDIESEHLVLLQYERSLVLAWALVEEKPNDEQPDNTKTDDAPGDGNAGGAEPPRSHLEIGLALSERKLGRWTTPHTSRARLSTAFGYRNLTKRNASTVPADYDLRGEDIALGIVEQTGGTVGTPELLCMLNPARIVEQSANDFGDLAWPHNEFLVLGSFTVDPCRLQIETHPRDGFVLASVHDTGNAHDLEVKYEAEKKQLQDDIVACQQIIAFNQPFLASDDEDVRAVAQFLIDQYQKRINDDNDRISTIDSEIEAAKAEAAVVVQWLRATAAAQHVSCQPGSDGSSAWRFRGQSALYERQEEEGQFFGGGLTVKDGGTTTALLQFGMLSGATIVRPLRLEGRDAFHNAYFAAQEHGWSNVNISPFVISTQSGSYFVERRVDGKVSEGYRFTLLSHPSVCKQLKALRASGVDGLLNDRDLQSAPHDPLGVNSAVLPGLKERDRESVSFKLTNASSIYNWELFFHAPLYVAVRLMAARRFEEARKWFERIFDPTQAAPIDDADKPWAERPYLFWKPRPLFENKDLAAIQEEMAPPGPKKVQSIKLYSNIVQSLITLDGGGSSDPKTDLSAQIEAWRHDPFKPYVIARLRTVAFQKAVVIKYIENLIEWGDELFRRDTIESITEATGLYILARDVLGPRPPKVSPAAAPPTKMAWELTTLDAFGNALIKSESLSDVPKGAGCSGTPLPTLLTLYFCVPGNEKLDELWDTIADRLFKIRHCMNIEGIERQLALFEPPIDPALLVQAAAAGVEIGSVLNDLSGGRLPYRFQILYGRAVELTGGVVQLGQSLLAAFEKQDGETLSLLRSSQEVDVLKAQRSAKALEVKEAEQSLAAAKASVLVIDQRRTHFASLISKGLIDEEQQSFAKSQESLNASLASASLNTLASSLAFLPDFELGVAGFNVTSGNRIFGGDKVALSVRMVADGRSTEAKVLEHESTRLTTKASYTRRLEDWNFQLRTAQAELAQAAKQVAAAEVSVAIARSSLEVHDLQIANAKTVDEYMRSKLTNEDLYEWMADRVMDVYYEAYKLAYDTAKRAERAMRAELAVPDSEPRFVGFGYWDSAKKGLGAGEQLQQSLRALDAAYHERNRRELEVTKHFSLLSLAPPKLLQLRETGACEVTLEEKYFDYDYPGHYLRRIKSVSATIPAVTGPYTGVSCRLTLLKNWMRKTSALKGQSYVEASPPDDRFAYDVVPIETVVTSSGQNDAGLFEVVLRDDRYLPFEGAGAISTWRIELQPETNAFDIGAIADLVLHLRYMARDGGGLLRDAAELEVVKQAGDTRVGLQRLVSLRTDFPSGWEAFMNPVAVDGDHVFALELTAADFPFLHGSKTIEVTGVQVFAKWSLHGVYDDTLQLSVAAPGQTAETDPLLTTTYGELATGDFTPASAPVTALGAWTITATATAVFTLPSQLKVDVGTNKAHLNDTLVDIWVLVTYRQDVGFQ